MEKIVFEGYGPRDLIARLKQASWTACVPSGKNFEEIVLGRWVLTDTPDELCPVKFRVTLETVPPRERFLIEGYNTRCFFDSMRKSPHLLTFAGSCLCKAPLTEDNAYRATIETLS